MALFSFFRRCFMKFAIPVLVAALSILPTLAVAQNAPVGAVVVEKEKGAVRGAKTIVVQGAITAIDPQTRHVTIKGGGGNEVMLLAGPEVRNFAQLKVGDIVTLQVVRSLALELKKGGTELRQRAETSDAVRAEPGEKPMGGEATSVRIIADVTAVNKKTGMVTLRGPQRTLDLQVKDKAMLKDIAVGDQVEANYVEATVLSVKEAKPAKATK
jgi:Cu/Ag efflux protein CusF